MNSIEEKKSLITEMISFANIDGKLHEKEYQFLYLIATDLGLDEIDFNELFHQENDIYPIKSENTRIEQFYRLALLMHIDGILHEKEQEKINTIAVNMGLNLHACKEVLKLIEKTPGKIIDANKLLDIFKKHYN